ncbi:serine-rich adhesin for platelets-like [Ixodes scapularis]|uniref:serine-rich adhesin for platelets-like n=1 Tax=Ixodes scapularis TaxID=6945 RepID=UPI001AD606DF|nr:serine-rich adhesin for platelets-like [Ixodes scapularis]
MSEQYSSDEEACICNGEVLVNHKRKETHNVVERRRKDKININILRLGDLLPDKDPKKQSKNGILERASDYIVYLKDLNEKLVMEKASDMEATIFARLRKQIRELEDLNANYARLLTTAGIPLNGTPEEIWDHKPKKYSLKHSPEKQRALVTCTEVKTALQSCQHHNTPPPPSSRADITEQQTQRQSNVSATQLGVMRDSAPGCTLVTQALPSAPVMSTAQPSAVTVFQQQPLAAMTPSAAAAGVMSQPILVINDQGVPVLQNVVTFQNTSIILNPQGHTMARAPGSVVSFPGSEMLGGAHVQLATAGQGMEDFVAGGLVQCDPKLKETKLCGVPPMQNATFLSGTGMMMNQPILSYGGGAAMIAGQNAAPSQVPSAFLLPSGQIIPVVSQPQVVGAPMPPHLMNGQVMPNVACTNSCSSLAARGKTIVCETSRSVVCREQASVTQAVQIKTSSVTVPACNTTTASTSSQQSCCKKQQNVCPQHSSSSSSKGKTLPDSSKGKATCIHSASKQALCTIRPKPTSQMPDSSQTKPSCPRKGSKKAARPCLEVAAKKARIEVARSDEENVASTTSCSSAIATAPSQGLESVSSTSNKGTPPLATDILAQATESIFSSALAQLPPQDISVSRSNSNSASTLESATLALQTSVSTGVTERSDTLVTVVSAASSDTGSGQLPDSRRSEASIAVEAVCSNEALQTTVDKDSEAEETFQSSMSSVQMDAETSSPGQATSNVQRTSAKEAEDSIETTDRNELSSLSLHSIVMEENIDISPSVSSTTFTESYVSVAANNGSNTMPDNANKMPDCAASILCQLTPPSSKGSEDNSKAFVSSTDSLTSDQELPLILSIPEDDGHGSLNSNSNPGLSFPSLSPGDQLEQELGNNGTNKNVESSSSLPSFSITPLVPSLSVSTAQASVSSSLSKKKDSTESVNTYAYVTSDAYPGPRSGDLHAMGNSGSKQDCHHASRSPQLQNLPSAKLLTETSCHSFVSSAPPTFTMQSRSLQFPPTQVQNSHTVLPGFSSAQGFAAPKEPDPLPPPIGSGKPPPSPCRMARDSGRSATPNKSLPSQFPTSINSYMATTCFPRPDQYMAGARSFSTSGGVLGSHSTSLSCYSAEALIGTQNFLPSSYRMAPPCTQLPTTQMTSCRQSSRPQISYSAESLIQSQASNSKKDALGGSKEAASFTNHPGFGNRLPYTQSQMSGQLQSSNHPHQRQVPASTTQQSHQLNPSISIADNRTHALQASGGPAAVNSSYHVQQNLAGSPARYPLHSYHHGKDDFPSLHTTSSLHAAPSTSHSTTHGHHLQPDASASQNVFQHQNYPYPNFTLGHSSPSFNACSSRPEVPPLSRAPSSCLQSSSPRQAHFGMQGPLPTSQQQGCLFPSSSGAPILPPLASEFGSQCSGPLAPPPPVFGNLSQHCAQAPHLVNNLIPGPFATTSTSICNAPLSLPTADAEKQPRREKSSMLPTSEPHCSDTTEKQNPKSKSKKNKASSSSHNSVTAIPYFPDFMRTESQNHALLQLPPPPAGVAAAPVTTQKLPHSSSSWQHQQHHKAVRSNAEPECSTNSSSVAYNPLFRPQSQNSINLNLNAPGPPPPSAPHSLAPPSFSHHHSPLQRSSQQSSSSSIPNPTSTTTSAVQGHYANCAVTPSHHVPNFNLSNIFPDIGAGSAEQSRGSSAHFYPPSRMLHNSFNHILPPPPPPAPHNNFVPSGHHSHAPSFSNVIPPLTFPMHEH